MTPQDTYHLMATIAFPAAALWALVQWYQSIRQRREELRWKRAEAAWRLMDEVFNDPQVAIAFDLVDGETSSIEVPGGGVEPVSAADIATALDPANVDGTPRARAIRDAFNCVLYSLDRLEGAIAFRRFVAPDRDALSTLAAMDVDWLEEQDRLHINEAADRFARMTEELEAVRERSALLHEQLTDLRAEQVDQRALVISIVAFIFLPLTFITGLLGMNVEGIP